MDEHTDVLIVGAGLSGICAAYYLQTHCPEKRCVVVESREQIGGTWDLFRYPGVRSDSDMYTLGFSFFPWRDPKAIADGPAIRAYLHETAQHFGIDRTIRFGLRLQQADWCSREARWHVVLVRASGEQVRMTCSFLYMCSGYYNYNRGYTPELAGIDTFGGQVVHPQFWPESLDVAGKRVVILGSGATAVTLVPALAARATHVTMLQRSPTYVVSVPGSDPQAEWLRRRLPAAQAHALVRWKNVLTGMFYYHLLRGLPRLGRRILVGRARRQLPPGYDLRHFTPRYNPWDQRICAAPDGDFFAAVASGTASVETGEIERFTTQGIRLRSGQEIPADVVVTATGLNMQLLGGVELSVDGEPVVLAQTMNYKGAMFSGVPNLVLSLGYTQASWTLKCELIARYVVRLLHYMDRHGFSQATPRRDPAVRAEPVVGFTSSYIQRALPGLPSQGSRRPWKLYQNYLLDMLMYRFGWLNDGVLEFRRSSEQKASVGLE